MGLIPESVIEQVLARADILSVVSNYVSLKKSGANHKGLCPFHDENTPSFNVNPSMGIYKCFGCGEGGNVINFLMQIEGWSFPETVRYLAERNGVEIPEEDPEEAEAHRKRREGKKLYWKVMELAREFYEDKLWSDAGAAALHYMKERGVDEETAREFGLGYAPKGWQNTIDHLEEHQIPAKLAERAGLALERRKSSGYYDRFRHRVMFPVVDIWGHTLAFGGRRLAEDEDSPKYINSPETRYYTKGNELYGLHVAKKSIQKNGMALLVEGNFDVITLHAAGFDMAVAPMGTAMTEHQARLLDRYADRVVVAFDGDDAGEEASVKCIPSLQETNLEAMVIRFDELEDPDTFVRRHGADALWSKIEQAQPLVAWALDRILAPISEYDAEKKVKALEEAGKLLREVKTEVVWKRYVEDVSRRLKVEPRLLTNYIKRPDNYRQAARRAVIESEKGLELEPAEEGILGVLMKHPDWIDDFLGDELDNMLSSQEVADFLHLASEHLEERDELNTAVLLEQVESPAFRNTVEDAMFDRRQRLPKEDEKHVRFFRECVRTLKRAWAKRTVEELTRQLEGLDFREDKEAFQELHAQKKQIEQFKASLDIQSGR
ncbi:MAG: DNA primase [Myxococcota bacterium]